MGPGSRGTPSGPRRPNSKHFSTGKSRGGGRDRGGKKRDLGRAEWAKQKGDKRQRNEVEQASKRQKLENGEARSLPVYATKFTEEELKDEERKPKKKVAVLIGYAGTGYKGMQLTHDQKTIEGDLFQAFVAAGAISKANADDPKKSSFVRCARTDKGVHAAGNVISLKLIVEDEDIVSKINENLVPQIRIWGFERTNNSFSAYQMVDSRIYEYLIPSHSFLPPHPRSYLGRKCEELAEQKGESDQWKSRQEEVDGYWDAIDEVVIKPILDEYDEQTRDILLKALYLRSEEPEKDGDATDVVKDNALTHETLTTELTEVEKSDVPKENGSIQHETSTTETERQDKDLMVPTGEPTETSTKKAVSSSSVAEAVKRLRQAYITAKRAYRIPEQRLERIRDTLNMFVGTKNYHNYTVDKTFRDPSSKRLIKSFTVNPSPILINGTEWLSLKVHGQSFMMHQIRKMVGMVALLVRCGCDPNRLNESFGPDRISVPKAPSLGLLLERPVFDSYNHKARKEFGKSGIDFDKYKTEMDEFKQREIYERMYRDEEKENVFGNFFNHVDNFPEPVFLFVTSGGIEASKGPGGAGQGLLRQKVDKEVLVDLEGEGESDDGDGVERVRDENGDEG